LNVLHGLVVEPHAVLSIPVVVIYQTLAACAGGDEKTKKLATIKTNSVKNIISETRLCFMILLFIDY